MLPLTVMFPVLYVPFADWAQHGICGRGVLLDLVSFYTSGSNDLSALSYDPWQTHAITVSDLEACAKKQGVEFKRGDILLYRMGFTKRYYEALPGERDGLSGKPETL